MDQAEAARKYALDERQEAGITALAQQRQESPERLVREAVDRYLIDVEYQLQRAAVMANLKHPERDNRLFGSWRGLDIDGLLYQNALRGDD